MTSGTGEGKDLSQSGYVRLSVMNTKESARVSHEKCLRCSGRTVDHWGSRAVTHHQSPAGQGWAPGDSCLSRRGCHRCRRRGHRRRPCRPCRGRPDLRWGCTDSCPGCFGDRPRRYPGCCHTCPPRGLSQSQPVGEGNSFNTNPAQRPSFAF